MLSEEGLTSDLSTLSFEETSYNWRISWETGTGSLSSPFYLCLCIRFFCHNIDFHLPFKMFCKVKEWLQYIGLGDHTTVVHDADEPDDGAVPIFIDDSAKNRW